MALCLCLVLLPATALAADGATVNVGNVELTGSTDSPAYATTDATTGAVTTTDATAENYNIMWDGETLTLRNAAIKEAKEYTYTVQENGDEVEIKEKIAVYLASGNMDLVLVGENTVEAPDSESVSSCGIHVGGSLTISGQDNGSLSVSGGDSSGSSYGIHAYDTITINSGSVNATSGEAKGDSIGIFAEYENYRYQNSITINGGTVIATAGDAVGKGWYSCGIRVEGPITINGGTVNATGKTSTSETSTSNISCGIYAVQSVNISGGTVTATGGTSKEYSSGIHATNLSGYNVEVNISGGTVTATGGAAEQGSYGILAETDANIPSTVTINGNSVVRANMTGTVGDNGEPISGIEYNTAIKININKESGIIFENGVGTVYGSVELQEDLTVAAGETLTIPEDAALTIPEGTTLTNNGRIQNDGNLQVKGEITGNAVTGSGTIQGSGQWPGKPEPVPIPPTYAVTTPETPGGTVTVSPSRASRGRTVTITATPDLGYELESLTVLDSRGNEIALTDKGDGKYTFTMPSSRVTVEASFTPAPLPFEDVTPGAWYEGAVRYAYFHNIMEGMSETEFAPATALTRAMAAQILYNLEGQPTVDGDNEFTDVSGWYETAVTWAAETGVAEGYGDGTFQPGDSITRQEFAQMLYNYAEYKGYDLTAEGDLSQFPDSGSVANWAETAMSWANGNKLINGHDDGAIDAAGIGTRAQAASILMKLDQNITA